MPPHLDSQPDVAHHCYAGYTTGLLDELAKTAAAPWMVETMIDQLGRLEGLLAKVQ